ncbi:hypothetical protein AB0L64_33600 [Kribbella sp. NPDC051936]|uniref:hypothetical protein n=1 Tax=Kribbella sp. NPDC051936 TaxID=3154946 RepID=UPI0034377210
MSIKRLWTAGCVALLVGVGLLAGPAAFAASSVSTVSFTSQSLVGGATADWTIGFKASNGSGALTSGSTITVTFPGAFSEPGAPAVTLGSTFGAGCTASSSAADGPPSGSDVITVTLGSGCSLAKGASGSVKLAGLTNAPVGTYQASTFKVSTSSDTTPDSPSSAITLTSGAASKLAFVQGPSSGYVGTPLTPAITVQVQDQVGNPVAASGVTITLAPSVGEISGASANTDATGKATFNAVVINPAALGITLTASSSGLTSTAPSTSFNVTVAVSSGATLSSNPTDVGGSGVKSVAYYYCAGYSGTCTSANWTLIGSTTAANYQVTWTGQPANGAYRVVAVSTDNVSNVSQPSGSTPVTVVN